MGSDRIISPGFKVRITTTKKKIDEKIGRGHNNIKWKGRYGRANKSRIN